MGEEAQLDNETETHSGPAVTEPRYLQNHFVADDRSTPRSQQAYNVPQQVLNGPFHMAQPQGPLIATQSAFQNMSRDMANALPQGNHHRQIPYTHYPNSWRPRYNYADNPSGYGAQHPNMNLYGPPHMGQMPNQHYYPHLQQQMAPYYHNYALPSSQLNMIARPNIQPYPANHAQSTPVHPFSNHSLAMADYSQHWQVSHPAVADQYIAVAGSAYDSSHGPGGTGDGAAIPSHSHQQLGQCKFPLGFC